MKDLIRIGISDAAERAGIGKSALQSVIGQREGRRKTSEAGFENVDTARIERPQVIFAGHHMKGSSFLRSGLGEN